MKYTRVHQYLCQLLWDEEKVMRPAVDIILDDVQKEFPLIEDYQLTSISQHLKISFIPQYAVKWQERNNTKDKFIKKHGDSFMLKTYTFGFPTVAPPEKKKAGRPRKNLNELSQRAQAKRHDEIFSQYSFEEVKRYVKRKERTDSESAKEQELDILEDEDENNNPGDYHQPLALLHDAHLTKLDYQKVRMHVKEMNDGQRLPGYDKMLELKKTCYPNEADITINEDGASVELIPLIQHTVQRIFMTLGEETLEKIKGKTLHLLGKWGMDGASGQQTTRQRWSSDSNDDTNSDSAVFLVTFRPLQLKADSTVVWQNDKPNSPFYTRPIAFTFSKETTDLISNTFEKYNSILKSKKNIYVDFEGEKLQLLLNIRCTMIDGKICNCLAGQGSTRSCYLCSAKPSDINEIPTVMKKKVETKELLKLGLASLHGWIKCMEYILHIAYRLDCDHRVSKGAGLTREQITSMKEENDEKVLRRQKKIRDELKERLSLTVDQVKQGAGTTNTGNVARAFFQNAQTVADITGVDERLITRLYSILQVTTSCKYTANIRKLREYCQGTAEMCIEMYSWYTMPPSVHKLLIHGTDIIQLMNNHPCGWFSEEAQESLNKFFREARLHRSRMCDRESTNKDIIHYLLEFSDPKITSLRKVKTTSSQELTIDAKELLHI